MKPILLITLITFVLVTGCQHKTDSTSSTVQSHSAQMLSGSKEGVQSVNSFDLAVIDFFQHYVGKYRFIDSIIAFIARNNFFKGGLLLIVFWWLWFPPNNQDTKERRIKIILTLFSGFVAILAGRILVLCLPFRVRPLNNPELHLNLPYGSENINLDKLSSFPSDHAVMFFAIATGLLLIARKAGILAFIYTLFFITFARVYLCFHYATDVLAGAAIGVVISLVICKSKWMYKMGEKIHMYSEVKPQFFYPAFFVLSFQLANLFEELRASLTFMCHL